MRQQIQGVRALRIRRGYSTAGALLALVALASPPADSVVASRQKALAAAPATAHLMVFGGRSAQQRGSPTAHKFDAALADLSRHLSRVREDHALEDLHSLSPAARFMRSAMSTDRKSVV